MLEIVGFTTNGASLVENPASELPHNPTELEVYCSMELHRSGCPEVFEIPNGTACCSSF
jgi:hypothetical protein